MTVDDRRFLDACALIRKHVPGYRAVLKSESRLHRLVGRLFGLFGNNTYMDRMWTTVDGVTGRPAICTDGAAPREWITILHEGRHAVDQARVGRWRFNLAYLLPQLLAAPGVLCAVLGACLASGGLVTFGLALLALAAPWPAPFRAWAEFRGYTTSMACTIWSGNMTAADRYVDEFLVPWFTGPSYYWMWPLRARVRRRFERELGLVVEKTLGLAEFEDDDYERDCFELCRRFRAEDLAPQPTG